MFPAKPGTVRQTGSFSGRACAGTGFQKGEMTSAFGRGRRKQTNRCLRLLTFLPGSVRAFGVGAQAQVWGLLFVWAGPPPRRQVPLIRPLGASPQYCYIMLRKLPAVTVWPSRLQARLQVGYQSIDLVLALALQGEARSLRHWLITSHAVSSGISRGIFKCVCERSCVAACARELLVSKKNWGEWDGSIR